MNRARNEENRHPSSVTYEDEIHLLDYWNVLVKYKTLIAAVVLTVTFVTAIVSLLKTPIYRAEVLVAPVTDEEAKGLSALANQFSGLAALAGVNAGGGKNSVELAIATLKSRAFTEAFIKEEGLTPILFEELWDPQKKAWNVKDQKGIPTAWNAYTKFNNARKVQQDRKTGLVTVSIEWKDAEHAARWANSLVERFNRHQQQDAIQEAEKSIAYLKQELLKTNIVEMQQMIYRLIEAQTKTITLANVRNQYAFKIIDPAMQPEEKFGPHPGRMIIISFVVSFMFAILLAFMATFVKRNWSNKGS